MTLSPRVLINSRNEYRVQYRMRSKRDQSHKIEASTCLEDSEHEKGQMNDEIGPCQHALVGFSSQGRWHGNLSGICLRSERFNLHEFGSLDCELNAIRRLKPADSKIVKPGVNVKFACPLQFRTPRSPDRPHTNSNRSNPCLTDVTTGRSLGKDGTARTLSLTCRRNAHFEFEPSRKMT
jgi:hypothetical protein